MRTTAKAFFCALCLMALFFCQAQELQAATGSQPVQIRIATYTPANSPWGIALKRFAEVAAKESNGEINVRVYTDGQLGDINQMFSGMQLGTLEMAYFGLGAVVFLKDADPLSVVYVPYLFKDDENMAKVLNSSEFKNLYDDVAKKAGVRVMGVYGTRSPRALQTTKGPIVKPEDFKGLRLRVAPLNIFKATFQKLGAQITPMNPLEIYNAMSRGTIDGQDNGFDISIPLKFHEVAKYWSATDMSREMMGWYISEKLWQKLTDAQRAALEKAAREGGEVSTQETVKLDSEALQILKNAGVTYTIPDRAAIADAVKDVYKEFDGTVWPAGLVDRVRAMQK
jgi:tripartite ATP-independent transporter DctP family solute receptor